MNKHTRLIVSVLFIGIIVLAVAITRFYSRTGKSAVSSGSQIIIEKKLGFDSSGNRAFQNNEGLVGIIDSSERVIVSPEWQSIKFTNSDKCIASKRIHGKELFGCIDYEGNIIIPFVYSNIEVAASAGRVLYIAQAADKKSSVVYNSDFVPCFSRAWDSCSYNNGDLTVTAGKGNYTYYVRNSDFIFKNAVLEDVCLDCPYSVNITASGLTLPMMEEISSTIGKYIKYAYSADSKEAKKNLAEIKGATADKFTTLFGDEERVTSRKLLGLSDISVISSESEDGVPHYTASVTADTRITYRNEENNPKRLYGKYKAVIEFAGSNESDFRAVYASFVDTKPDYPEAAPEIQQGTASQEN